jgi:hypothetical protein
MVCARVQFFLFCYDFHLMVHLPLLRWLGSFVSGSGSAAKPISSKQVMISSKKGTIFAFRKPVRITITLSHSTFDQLQRRSDQEGRSLSNLSAYLLESAIAQAAP